MSMMASQQAFLRRRRIKLLGRGAVASGVVLLLVAVIMSLFVRDFVREAIVVPVSYLIWLVDLVLRSIPQSAFWGAVVAAAALVAWRGLGSARTRTAAQRLLHRRPTVVPVLRDHAAQSVFSTRFEYIARMNDSLFAREKLAFDLRILLVKLLSHRERLPEAEIERRIRAGEAGELTTPPAVHSLLTNWQTWLSVPDAGSPVRQLTRLWQWLLRKPTKASQPNVAMEQRLTQVIEYMEILMSGGPLGSSEEEHE